MHLDLDGLADQFLGGADDDHGAVIEITDALALVFAFAGDTDVEHVAGEDGGFQRSGKGVQVDERNGLELGHFAEVEVVRVKLRVEDACELEELGIDFLFLGEIHVMHAHFAARVLADAVQHVEAASAARPADGVLRIGNELQLAKNELRHHNDAFDEAAFNEIGDAAIDNHAGIEHDLVLGLVLRTKPDVGDEQREVFLVAAHRENHPDVAEAKKHRKPQEPACSLIREDEKVGAVDHPGHHCPEHQAEGGGGESSEREAFEHLVQCDEQSGQPEADDAAIDAALDNLGAVLAYSVARHRTKQQEETSDDPK